MTRRLRDHTALAEVMHLIPAPKSRNSHLPVWQTFPGEMQYIFYTPQRGKLWVQSNCVAPLGERFPQWKYCSSKEKGIWSAGTQGTPQRHPAQQTSHISLKTFIWKDTRKYLPQLGGEVPGNWVGNRLISSFLRGMVPGWIFLGWTCWDFKSWAGGKPRDWWNFELRDWQESSGIGGFSNPERISDIYPTITSKSIGERRFVRFLKRSGKDWKAAVSLRSSSQTHHGW